MDEIETDDVTIPTYPTLLFEIHGDCLMTRVAWPENFDPETFVKVLSGVQKGEWLHAVIGSIRGFGEAIDDEDFAENLAIALQHSMEKVGKTTPYVRPRAAIPMLTRRGAGE